MPEETMNTQTGQSENLVGNAGQTANGFQQDGANSQSTEWDAREKAILAKAYQQAQSLVDKSASRQSTQFQSVIDQFKRDFGVTLTPEQAQEMAQNQSSKSSQPNAPVSAQAQAQQANASDPSYMGFLYYHGVQDNPIFRQAFQIQNMLGVKLEESDPEYKNLYNRETKYQPNEFVDAWKQACISKITRLQSMQQPENKDNTNLGQLPLVGSQGKKSNNYDPNRTAKSYFQEYYKDMKK